MMSLSILFPVWIGAIAAPTNPEESFGSLGFNTLTKIVELTK